MKKITKIFNLVQIISTLLATIVLILCFIFPKANLIGLFWILMLIQVIGNALFLKKWSKDGITWFRKADKSYSKNITRKPADSLLLITVFYTLIFLFMYFLDIVLADNIYRLIRMIIILFISYLNLGILAYITNITKNKLKSFMPRSKN